jgi:hypothetical protein
MRKQKLQGDIVTVATLAVQLQNREFRTIQIDEFRNKNIISRFFIRKGYVTKFMERVKLADEDDKRFVLEFRIAMVVVYLVFAALWFFLNNDSSRARDSLHDSDVPRPTQPSLGPS